jgi:Ribonuclease G/E
MSKKVKLSERMVQLALETAKKAKAPELLRMAQTVVIPSIFDVSDRTIGEIIGRSRPTVVRLRKKFREMCAGEEEQRGNWGGRRYGYMTVEDERKFLAQFLDKAEQGGILVVSEIKRAFETLVGRKVAKTTIYRMLDRHNWRTIIPRPCHPNSDIEAQEGFKKTPENGE